MRTKIFQDFDEFAGSACGIESKMLMREPQHRGWEITHLELREIEVQLGRLGSGNIAAGEVRPDTLIIYLPMTRGVQYGRNGVVMDPDSFCVLEPGAEFCISTKVSHDWVAAFIPVHLFAQSIVDSMARSCRVTAPNRELSTQIRSTIAEIMNTAYACPGFESSEAAEHAQSEVRRLASRILIERSSGTPTREGRPKMSRADIVHQVIEFLDQPRKLHVGVGDLAAAASVSQRTRRSVFNEFFDMSPGQFLRTRRLHEIHRALKADEPESKTVTAILADQGAWAHSRIASQYRRIYGELSSATLARQPQGPAI